MKRMKQSSLKDLGFGKLGEGAAQRSLPTRDLTPPPKAPEREKRKVGRPRKVIPVQCLDLEATAAAERAAEAEAAALLGPHPHVRLEIFILQTSSLPSGVSIHGATSPVCLQNDSKPNR